MIVLEAFARGVPVIATDIGGTPELVRHGADGLLVPPDDADALAAALRMLVDDPARARSMGKAARQKIEQRFTRAHYEERQIEVYRSLAHQPLAQGSRAEPEDSPHQVGA